MVSWLNCIPGSLCHLITLWFNCLNNNSLPLQWLLLHYPDGCYTLVAVQFSPPLWAWEVLFKCKELLSLLLNLENPVDRGSKWSEQRVPQKWRLVIHIEWVVRGKFTHEIHSLWEWGRLMYCSAIRGRTLSSWKAWMVRFHKPPSEGLAGPHPQRGGSLNGSQHPPLQEEPGSPDDYWFTS